jgi:hypothetical protein
MSEPGTPGTTLLPGRCIHCDGSMLIHDGSTGEITCQMCARTWNCDPAQPGHERCAVVPMGVSTGPVRQSLRRRSPA